jgi:archaellum component FlaF (FlaF/FlaG flagellin family)
MQEKNIMKGIAPIMAIIMLLGITVAFIFFAWVWFQNVASVASDAGEGVQEIAGKSIMIQAVDYSTANTAITVLNNGTQDIQPGELNIFIRNVVSECNPRLGILSAGGTATCIVRSNNCAGGWVKVVAPGNEAEYYCE